MSASIGRIWKGQRLAADMHRPAFLRSLPVRADILDVGCGNNSPHLVKSIRPDVRYVGLDIGDYNQQSDPAGIADEYLLVSPDSFVAAIQNRSAQFDAVISSHNLEHCLDPDGVVIAMARALRPSGRIYFAFPAAASVRFPPRAGTLNFFDDPTHMSPPNFNRVLELLSAEGVHPEYAVERYRPPTDFVRGLLNEPASRMRKAVMRGTWALYGFESIIWGVKYA